MRTPTDKSLIYTYPGLVAIVTSRSEGKQNIMAAAWHTYLGMEPPTYGVSIGRARYTFQLIEKSGVFAVNFLPAHLSEWIQLIGTTSGRDIDKFEAFRISYEDGLKVDVPILKDAYFAYECKVTDVRTHGDHELFSGEILQTYKDAELFKENQIPDLSKLQIPLYFGRAAYLIADDTAKVKKHYNKD
ncbi:flavin reductase family protein [Aneurinibacillus tyrosinisolvens]|uniref:flavin reductase family protein n=1 Tax=Aneurinibacillus tyrosinisolvens TaxID=1443435 RepID=UPI00063F4013|nr:flavin reductase family protein [Aneurinibacillus tyrosinisolvens]